MTSVTTSSKWPPEAPGQSGSACPAAGGPAQSGWGVLWACGAGPQAAGAGTKGERGERHAPPLPQPAAPARGWTGRGPAEHAPPHAPDTPAAQPNRTSAHMRRAPTKGDDARHGQTPWCGGEGPAARFPRRPLARLWGATPLAAAQPPVGPGFVEPVAPTRSAPRDSCSGPSRTAPAIQSRGTRPLAASSVRSTALPERAGTTRARRHEHWRDRWGARRAEGRGAQARWSRARPCGGLEPKV